jgi:hypothetical protein
MFLLRDLAGMFRSVVFEIAVAAQTACHVRTFSAFALTATRMIPVPHWPIVPKNIFGVNGNEKPAACSL